MLLPESWPCSHAATKTGTAPSAAAGGTHSARRPSARLPTEYAIERQRDERLERRLVRRRGVDARAVRDEHDREGGQRPPRPPGDRHRGRQRQRHGQRLGLPQEGSPCRGPATTEVTASKAASSRVPGALHPGVTQPALDRRLMSTTVQRAGRRCASAGRRNPDFPRAAERRFRHRGRRRARPPLVASSPRNHCKEAHRMNHPRSPGSAPLAAPSSRSSSSSPPATATSLSPARGQSPASRPSRSPPVPRLPVQLLRAAEGADGWLAPTALAAGITGITLKLGSVAPELAMHRAHLAAALRSHRFGAFADGATVICALPARGVLRGHRDRRAAHRRPAALARRRRRRHRRRARRQRRLPGGGLRARAAALHRLDAGSERASPRPRQPSIIS